LELQDLLDLPVHRVSEERPELRESKA